MPIARPDTASPQGLAGTLLPGTAFHFRCAPARDDVSTGIAEPENQPTIPRTMKNNSDGPSKHPSPVWNVAVNAP